MICTEVAGMKRILVKIVLPVSLLAVWMITCYPICRKAEGFDFFLYWVLVGCPYGIDPLWRTLKEKGISQYQLIKDYGIDKAQLQRLRQNLVVKTLILNRLCQILNCRIEEIMEYVPDDN